MRFPPTRKAADALTWKEGPFGPRIRAILTCPAPPWWEHYHGRKGNDMKTWPRSCPKCSGDLVEEVSVYDTYVYCKNCRYTLTHREKEWLAGIKPEAPEAIAKQPKVT